MNTRISIKIQIGDLACETLVDFERRYLTKIEYVWERAVVGYRTGRAGKRGPLAETKLVPGWTFQCLVCWDH